MGMDTSKIDLADCHMHSSQGPAVDISGKARLSMSGGSIKACVGNSKIIHLLGRQRLSLHAPSYAGRRS